MDREFEVERGEMAMSEYMDKRSAESKKMVTEVKEVIRKMVADGEPVTSKNVVEKAGISRATIYNNPEIKKFFMEQQEKQKEAALRVDTELQQKNLHTKLMASYIFAYSLLDEQEEFYKTAISELKGRNTPSVSNENHFSIDFACQVLSNETDVEKATTILEYFQNNFAAVIPDWKDQLMKKLGQCPAFDILNQMADE